MTEERVKKMAAGSCREKRAAGKAGVDEFLAALPPRQRAALRQLRKTVRSVVPDAVERISWRMPMFFHCGPLVAFAAFKEHCSFFVMSTSVIRAFSRELRSFDTAKGTIRFSQDEPLPVTLVRKLVEARVAENDARRARRR